MQVALFMGLVLVICAGAVSMPPLIHAKRNRNFSVSDLLLPVAPAFLLFIFLVAFNADARVGWAYAVYPFLCATACVALLYIRVFVLPTGRRLRPKLSLWLLITASVAASIFGVFAPPWYE